jgi:hypothetical protein
MKRKRKDNKGETVIELFQQRREKRKIQKNSILEKETLV